MTALHPICVFSLAALACTAAAQTVPIALTIPPGAPIQIALDNEVHIRKVGQPIQGHVVQPVYVFDRLLIPAGTVATGRISRIEPIPGKTRALAILNTNFTPAHSLGVDFDQLVFANGTRLPFHSIVTPGSGQVIRLASAGEHDKRNPVHDAAAQGMAQARQQWNDAFRQVHQPGKMHRFLHYAVANLPVHPNYIDAGTLYAARLAQPLTFGSEPFPAGDTAALGTQPPPGSLVHAQLSTPLSSATTRKGAEIDAVLSQPLFADGAGDTAHPRLILPEGTHLRGLVLQVRPARGFHRNGQLRIAFRQIVLPGGTPQRVDTSLEGIQSSAADNLQLDGEGGARGTSSKTRYLSTGASVGLALIGSGGRNDVGDASPIAGGATGFKLIGLIVGIAFRSHTFGIVTSAYGGSRSIYTNFLGRGRNIVFAQDTPMEIGFGSRTAPPIAP